MKDEVDKILNKKPNANEQWHDYKRKLFMEAYFKCNGVNNEIARELGIHRVQVWRLRKQFNLL